MRFYLFSHIALSIGAKICIPAGRPAGVFRYEQNSAIE